MKYLPLYKVPTLFTEYLATFLAIFHRHTVESVLRNYNLLENIIS